MTPARRKQAWYQAHAPYLWALALAMAAGWGYDRLQVARYGERVAILPDQLGSLERRIAALEARCGGSR